MTRHPALLLALFIAGPAHAQALKNHNTDAPVDFAADRIEVQDRADRAVLSGNVNIRQGDLTLTAARMTIAYTGELQGGNPKVDRVDASGGVTVRSTSETASGSFAIYDLNRKIITMIGGVSLQQGNNKISGGRLVIDLRSGRSVIDGSNGSAPGVTGSGGGRVTGRFSVPQRN